jgi:hypothetical protein
MVLFLINILAHVSNKRPIREIYLRDLEIYLNCNTSISFNKKFLIRRILDPIICKSRPFNTRSIDLAMHLYKTTWIMNDPEANLSFDRYSPVHMLMLNSCLTHLFLQISSIILKSISLILVNTKLAIK